MNQLNVNQQQTILTLHRQGWGKRRIARELDLNRETVGRYLRLDRSKPAISTPGSEADPAAKPAILTPGSEGDCDPKPAISTAGCGRQSCCLPWQPQIEAAVLELSAEHRAVLQLREFDGLEYGEYELEVNAGGRKYSTTVLVDNESKNLGFIKL